MIVDSIYTIKRMIDSGSLLITVPRSGTHLLNRYAIPEATGGKHIPITHTHPVHKIFSGFDLIFEDPLIETEKIKCVLVTREDIFRRAISNHILHYTRQDTSLDTREKEPVYNFKKILEYLYTGWSSVKTTKTVLSHYRCPVLNVTYEELCADLNATVGKILDFVGIAQVNKVSLEDAPFKKQADATTEEYVQRFLEDIGHVPLDVVWKTIFRTDKKDLSAIYGDIF